MTNASKHNFDPVVLDLADHETQTLLIAALRSYADVLDDCVVDAEKRTYLTAPTADSTNPGAYSQAAATVREIVGDIEQQLASNQSARDRNLI